MTDLGATAVTEPADEFTGRMLTAADPGYDEARRVWNGGEPQTGDHRAVRRRR